jgi:2-methylcitrate dehydratase PrpD
MPQLTEIAAASKQQASAKLLATFCATLRPEDVPESVLQEAKNHFLDALGVALAAASLAGGQGIEGAVRRMDPEGESTAIGFRQALPAAWAALVNGALVHSLEYDDTHTASIIHGSSLVLPTVLAAAERERRSGLDVLVSFVAGWESLVRLGAAAPGAFQLRGFQTTAVCGPFVSAALTARLHRLSLEEAVNAVGIAGSQASGVFAFLEDGATVKSLHPGWAAHAGYVAAHLAAGGMTGPLTVFEARHGFYNVYANTSAYDRLREELATLGTRWELPNACVKLYPCCHYIHPFLECMEILLAENRLPPSDIKSIECVVPVEEAPIICDSWERRISPASGYEAKFSLPYCLAALVVNGAVDVSTFAADSLSLKAIEFAKRIRYVPIERSGYPARFPGRVRVALHGGINLEKSVDDVRGGPARPVSVDVVVTKFIGNAVRRISRDAAERIVERVMDLDALDELAPLSEDLRAVADRSEPRVPQARPR